MCHTLGMETEVDRSAADRAALIVIIVRLQATVLEQQRRIAELPLFPQRGDQAEHFDAEALLAQDHAVQLGWGQTATPTPGADPLTGVCKGFSGRRMVCDLQVGLGLRPGFRQTRLQRRPLSSKRLSQSMPWRITLTVRGGRLPGSR